MYGNLFHGVYNALNTLVGVKLRENITDNFFIETLTVDYYISTIILNSLNAKPYTRKNDSKYTKQTQINERHNIQFLQNKYE